MLNGFFMHRRQRPGVVDAHIPPCNPTAEIPTKSIVRENFATPFSQGCTKAESFLCHSSTPQPPPDEPKHIGSFLNCASQLKAQ